MNEPPGKPVPTAREFNDAERYLVELFPTSYQGKERTEMLNWLAEDLAELRAFGTPEEEVDLLIRGRLKTAHKLRLRRDSESSTG
jgi:hypothetical protein